MKVRKDFNEKNSKKHLQDLRLAINYLWLVDEVGGLPGGKILLDELYTIADKIENLIIVAEKSIKNQEKNYERRFLLHHTCSVS